MYSLTNGSENISFLNKYKRVLYFIAVNLSIMCHYWNKDLLAQARLVALLTISKKFDDKFFLSVMTPALPCLFINNAI